MFKVGELVQIDYYKNNGPIFGHITKTSTNQICDVQLTDGTFDAYHESFIKMASQPTISPPPQVIQVGDLVSGTNPYQGAYTGTVIRMDSSLLGTPCQVLIGYGLTSSTIIENIGNLTLVSKVVTSPPPPTQNLTVSSGGVISVVNTLAGSNFWRGAAAIWEPEHSKQPTHKHDWKFYMGLNERYEFCTSCNDKRDTDRRS